MGEPGAAPMRFHVQLLGIPRVRSGESWQPFVPDQLYQLLAYLASHGDWVNRDRAAFLFWPDTDTYKAKQNLRALLHRVRMLEWLPAFEADAYRMRWPVATDVRAFRQALTASRIDEALSLYQGPFLRDMGSDATSEFSDWLALERGHLHTSWREAVLRRAEERSGAGQYAKAAELLTRLLAEDAFDQEALQSYVTSLARAGQQREALRSYSVFAQRLQDEFGMEPTSATRHLAEAVRDNRLQRTPAPPLPEPSPVLPDATTGVLETADSEVPGWLPTPVTSFAGREVELARVRDLLSRPDCRLLTLSGTGGIGKTRLALRAAQELRRRYREGAYFVPLDALSSPELIPSKLAAALEMPLQGLDPPLAQVIRHLAKKQVLLLLDNFEHLLEGATLASDLLRKCPEIKLLVTSRERLDLKGEWVLPLEGLSYSKGDTPPETASDYEAVELFVSRAQKVNPGFFLSETELPYVLRICRLVEGMPLALEMAAVWVRAMPAEEIAAELETDLDLLSTTSRNARPRHQSVRAAFEHSWRLLSPTEQEVLRKLSVFRGGFQKEAAAYVADASIAVLAALVDKSLLRLTPDRRYDRHALLFQYTREKLAEDEEVYLETQRKHTAYLLSLAETAETYRQGNGHTTWIKRLEREQANFRASLQWLNERNEIELSLRLTGALAWFWWQRGNFDEGRTWLEAALTRSPEATAARAQALNRAGLIAWSQTLYSSARLLQEECLSIRRALQDRSGVVLKL